MSSPTSGEPTGPGAARPEALRPGAPSAGYRERLMPALWIWLSALMLATLTALVSVPFGLGVVVVVGPLAFVLLGALLVSWSPVVTVADGELVAGRAHVPVRLLGDVTALDAAAMRHALGPGFDARAYLCIRGWISTGVRADLVDPDDPTPYWLISSRRPDLLVAALRQARAGSGPA